VRVEGFSQGFEELIDDQGEAAFIITVDDKECKPLQISAYSIIPSSHPSVSPLFSVSPTQQTLAHLFLAAAIHHRLIKPQDCGDQASFYLTQTYPSFAPHAACKINPANNQSTHLTPNDTCSHSAFTQLITEPSLGPPWSENIEVPPVAVFGKKYKPVAQKVQPVIGALPQEFRIVCNIIGDPLRTIPHLEPQPPTFVPTNRYTQECKDAIDDAHHDNFLWPEEQKLMHHFMMLQNKGFAWCDPERGRFKAEFFPPVEIPTVPHIPWIQKNIPILPGIYPEVCKIIKSKMDNGAYEPSNLSYRSHWFCVAKKDGRLRIVHSLEPLNKVTIPHSGVTPIPEHLAEQFVCWPCGAMLDLYIGYDECIVHEDSRDLTTFQTPFGSLRLVTLPMGWTNLVPIFHDDVTVTHILRAEIPNITIPYIDDVPVKGPASMYRLVNGLFETIPDNPGIRRFVLGA
jgi:hypothetical protein